MAEEGNSKHRKIKICYKLQQSRYQNIEYVFILFIYLCMKICFNTGTAAVCDRSISFYGCFRLFVSYVCYVVEMSLPIYM